MSKSEPQPPPPPPPKPTEFFKAKVKPRTVPRPPPTPFSTIFSIYLFIIFFSKKKTVRSKRERRKKKEKEKKKQNEEKVFQVPSLSLLFSSLLVRPLPSPDAAAATNRRRCGSRRRGSQHRCVLAWNLGYCSLARFPFVMLAS